MTTLATRQFARLIIAFHEYLDDIVFVGGWVHALYLAEANHVGAVQTEDVDVALPLSLPAGNRPSLLDLALTAGFTRDAISDLDDAPVWMVYQNADGMTIPIDFLTEGEPRQPVKIIGQPGLLAQGYPGQRMLVESSRWLEVGPRFHPLLQIPRRVRVPTLGAYIVQKAISSHMRGNRQKAAKDLAYIAEILRHHELGTGIAQQVRALQGEYPTECARGAAALRSAVSSPVTLLDVAEQLIEAGRAYGDRDAVAGALGGRFRRFLEESA